VTFLPLEGVRVLDLTSSLAGPYCTQILGALGAEVVKVEHPARGDETRQWGPPFSGGESVMFLAVNAGKRSLALDFSTAAGLDALLRLADRADVLVQSLRPGTAARRGFGPDAVRARNERLVYCTIGAFGRVGPRSAQPGYDPLMQAAGGLMSVTGEPDRPGVRSGASLVDQGTGTWAALGIVAALHERARTGVGRTVDVSLFETAVALLPYQLSGYLATGQAPGRHGTAFGSIVPYQTFATRDGEVMVAAANDGLFRRLCEALGAPDLADDERFGTNPARVAYRETLIPLLAERFAADDAAAWLERLERAGVPAAPVQDVAAVAADDQTRALGLLHPLPHPDAPNFVTVPLPLSLDGERIRQGPAAPRLGADSAAVLAEAGYSEAEIDSLAADGVVLLGNGPAR
jgi:formyl-CoA transferase/CoA:oxalate CoA-transferase